MSETSWEVKARYNKKVYKTITLQLKIELVERLNEQLKKDGISKADFFRNAINEYLEKTEK